MKIKQSTLHRLEGYMFVSPWLIGFTLFLAYPFGKSLIMSFGRITDISNFDISFVGLDNYVKAFILDVEFLPKFLSTISWTLLNTPLIIVYSLFIAILLNRGIKGKGFFRAVFFLPVLLGTGLVMQQILGLDAGSIGRFDDFYGHVSNKTVAGARGISLSGSLAVFLSPDLRDVVQNLLDSLTQVFWRSGIQMLIFIGALQGIPDYLYEAAKCDGATAWEMFWKVTLPIISPTILLNTVFTLIDSFTSMNNPVMKYTLKVAFDDLQLGYGTALGWIFFLFVFLIIGLVFAMLRRHTYYLGAK